MASESSAPRVIVLLGPPCSGKSTQAKKLSDKFGFVHVSTGDLFRDHVRRKTPLGQRAARFIDAGRLVPDDLTLAAVRERVEFPDVKRHGCILDGFPRTAAQAKALAKSVTVDKALLLTVPRKDLLGRRAGRRVDAATGSVYNINVPGLKPPAGLASGRLSRRRYDGDAKAFRVRLDSHDAQMKRILPFFRNIETVSASGSPDAVHARICATVRAPIAVVSRTSGVSSQMCAVCLSEPASHIVTPCGHQCGCKQCLETLKQSTGICPICRGRIGSIIRVFASGSGTGDARHARTHAGAPATQMCISAENVAEVVRRYDAIAAGDDISVSVVVDPQLKTQSENDNQDDDEWSDDPNEKPLTLMQVLDKAGLAQYEAKFHELDVTLAKLRALAGDSRLASGLWARLGLKSGHKIRLIRALRSLGVIPAVSAEEQRLSHTGPQIAMRLLPPEPGCPKHHQSVVVQVTVPERAGTRPPADVVCVVDTSASMGSLALVEDKDGKKKGDGLTILDLTKHSLKTVVRILQDKDRFSLVVFSDKGKLVLPLTLLTAEGRKSVGAAIDAIEAKGQTNLWDGLRVGLDALRRDDAKSAGSGKRQSTMMLLTDGQPNITPPRGELTELRDYKDKRVVNCQINTFGFGYDLDSSLLLSIAEEGGGTFAFIPDAVIVGTVFVDSIANVLSTFARGATVKLSTAQGATFRGPVLGGMQSYSESWGRGVRLGPLTCGQNRTVVVPLRLREPINDAKARTAPLPLTATLEYLGTDGKLSRVVASGPSTTTTVNLADAHAAVARAQFVTKGQMAINLAAESKGRRAQAEIKLLVDAYLCKGAVPDADVRLVGLHSDATGRMTKALNGKARFKRWGRHYLRALTRSHQIQHCTNFMDTGLQPYGGENFRALRKQGDSAFLSLPPPKPDAQNARLARSICGTQQPPPASQRGSRRKGRRTGRRKRSKGGSPAAAQPAAAVGPPAAPSMTSYYAGGGGGCFGARSIVQVRTHSGIERKQIQDLERGDRVRVDALESRAKAPVFARVLCVAKMLQSIGSAPLVQLSDGLTITPGHPVLHNGRWVAALEHSAAVNHIPRVKTLPSILYNVVLDHTHVLNVDGVACVTWGHQLRQDGAYHPFYGSQRVVLALMALPGFHESGIVHVRGCVKDAQTHRTIGFY